ncbi:hypothetical protein AAG906_001280 [Vitis piasezkii]
MGSRGKQSIGGVHQNQEFSIQNEDFPASPGFKGGNTDFPVDSHRKEQLHDTTTTCFINWKRWTTFHRSITAATATASISFPLHMDSAAPRPAVIINYGTGYTKMGFVGNVEPCFIAPIVAQRVAFESKSSPTNPSYPIVHGQVDNWDVMEKFWQHSTHLESREYTGEIIFETFNVPGLYIAVQPVLALVTGYTTSKCEMTEEDLGSFIAD